MEIAIKVSTILIICVILILLVFATWQVFTTLRTITDTAQRAAYSQLTVNAPNTLQGYRESSGTAKHYTDIGWVYSVDDSEVERYLQDAFNLDGRGRAVNEGKHIFSITNIRVSNINAEGSRLTFVVTLDVALPVNFAGVSVATIEKTLKVKGVYDAKY